LIGFVEFLLLGGVGACYVYLWRIHAEIGRRLDTVAELQKQLLVAAQARDVTPPKSLPLRNGQPWTEEEKQEVKESHEKGESLEDIATQHERTVGAIQACLVKQGLIHRW